MRYSFVVACLLWLINGSVQAQSATKLPSTEEQTRLIVEFQAELNAEYRDVSRSPLPVPVRRKFTSLPFFPINPAGCVLARFVRDSSQAPFAMPTSTDRKALYRKYGELHFTLVGQPQT